MCWHGPVPLIYVCSYERKGDNDLLIKSVKQVLHYFKIQCVYIFNIHSKYSNSSHWLLNQIKQHTSMCITVFRNHHQENKLWQRNSSAKCVVQNYVLSRTYTYLAYLLISAIRIYNNPSLHYTWMFMQLNVVY